MLCHVLAPGGSIEWGAKRQNLAAGRLYLAATLKLHMGRAVNFSYDRGSIWLAFLACVSSSRHWHLLLVFFVSAIGLFFSRLVDWLAILLDLTTSDIV
ncbi:hypothetical protein VTL71DRAFT_12634 [Oculimacula yallundae]|uniref:Uncharacterized protein n=1 Tax=Oculimacula yallundae TaxID=86028 RepID=A0ABR4CNL8_9HELO